MELSVWYEGQFRDQSMGYGFAGGLYTVPLDAARQWSLQGFGSTALVDYLRGLGWRSRDNVWQVLAGYACGVDTLRKGERGAHSLGLIIPSDLEARPAKAPFAPGVGPDKSRFRDHLFAR